MSEPKPRIGYLGLGLMGAPMVRRLLEAEYDVVVWNRSKEKLEPIVAAGAREAGSPADLASQVDIVLMCVTDAKAVEAVVFDEDGIAGVTGPKALVDFSSIHPEAARDLAIRLKDANDISWIDAPVSGGIPGAENGTLAIMAGGDATDIEYVRPVVMNLCARFTHMGPTGAGQATKLCNQIISGCTITIVAEAVAFAEKSGVDATRLTEALKGGFADSIPFQLFAPRMAAKNFEPPYGTVLTMLKDLDTVAAIADEVDARLPMTSNAIAIMRETEARGDTEVDISAIIKSFISA
jgi:3-hydroxyisobutyrate dehydrogenase